KTRWRNATVSTLRSSSCCGATRRRAMRWTRHWWTRRGKREDRFPVPVERRRKRPGNIPVALLLFCPVLLEIGRLNAVIVTHKGPYSAARNRTAITGRLERRPNHPAGFRSVAEPAGRCRGRDDVRRRPAPAQALDLQPHGVRRVAERYRGDA